MTHEMKAPFPQLDVAEIQSRQGYLSAQVELADLVSFIGTVMERRQAALDLREVRGASLFCGTSKLRFLRIGCLSVCPRSRRLPGARHLFRLKITFFA